MSEVGDFFEKSKILSRSSTKCDRFCDKVEINCVKTLLLWLIFEPHMEQELNYRYDG